MSKLKGLKKTLAVFMAALMVMSCWVFTPVSFEAEAATAGSYYYKVVANCTEATKNGWTGWAWRIFGKYNNGQGNENAKPENGSQYYTEQEMNEIKEFTIFSGYGEPGWFPTKVTYEFGCSGGSKGITFDIYVYVGKSADSLTCIYSNNYHYRGSNFYLTQTWDLNGKPEQYKLPEATSVSITSGASSITIPKTGEMTALGNYTAGVYDQYGVQMTYDPEYYVCETEPTSAGEAKTAARPTGCDINTSTGELHVDSDAQIPGETDTKTIYVAAVYGDKFTTKAVTLNDQSYTFTLDANGGTLAQTTYTKNYGHPFGTVPTPTRTGFDFRGFYQTRFDDSYETTKYYGNSLASDTTYDSNRTWYAAWQAQKYNLKFVYRDSSYNERTDNRNQVYFGREINATTGIPTTITKGDHIYTFKHWALATNLNTAVTFPTTMPANDVQYVAVYNDTLRTANLDALKEQIAAADAKKATEYYTKKGYTDESISALNSAYDMAKSYTDSTPLSQQTNVDAATETLKAAIENLTLRDVTVIFKDETGSVLKDGYATVKWGESVTVPADPSIDNDISNHYIFKGWLGSEDPVEFCKRVTEDKIFLADFEAEAHTYKNEVIQSTCTSDGAIKHTCQKCNFSYTEASGVTAHHTWKATKDIIKAATCSSNGIKATVCEKCGVYQKDSIESIPTTAHAFGEYTTEVERTCQGKGIKYRECSNCEAREYIYEDKYDHNFDRTTINATCTTGGYTKQVCSRCNLIKISAETPAKDHNLNTVTTLEPTCMSVGYKTTTCSNKNCDYEKIEIIPALTSHSYPDTWTTVEAATCGHQGIEKRECSACRMTEYQVTPKLAEHNWDSGVETVKATCTRDGLKTYTCGTCGATKTETIDSLGGHNLVNDPDNSQAATCTSPEIVAQKCSNADCDYTTKEVGAALGHDLEATTTVAATCNNAGYKVWECKNTGCDYGYIEYTDAATGNHDWKFTTSQSGTQLTVKGECSSCKATTETTVTVAEGHTYSSVNVTKQPTCKETGTIVIACDKSHNAACAATIEATLPINPDAHKNITTANTPADCTNGGKVVTACDDCNAKIAETTIPAKGHSYTTKVSETLATCKTAGSVTLKCADCDDTKNIETGINPNAHKYEKTSSVAATCTTSAYDVYTCQNGCGATYNMYTGDALGHDWGEAVVQQNGNLITVTRTCGRVGCGETETVLTNKAIDYRHDYSGTVETVTNATCKTEGKIKVHCKDAGCDSYVEINIGTNAKAHTLKTEYKAPDCLNDGYVKTSCTECTNELSNQKIDKLGHDFFTNLETTAATTPATCTSEGTKTVTCSRCEATTNVTIPKLGHSYKKVSGGKAATCTEYGWDKYECENCDATYNELIKESGHKLTGEPETIAPTCTEQGYTKQYCEACGEWIKSDYVNASGHNFTGAGTVVTPPICTAGGYTTYTCQNDGCTYSYVGDYTPASSHDYTGENSTVVTPPTCTSKGYTAHKCKNCEYYFIDTYVDATGHDFDMTKGEAGTDAETGKNYTKYPCKHECGEYQYEYLGDGCSHVNWEYVKTVAPTCTQDGYDIYSCPTCRDNAIKTNIKPALGHNWDYWEIEKYPYVDADGTQHNGIQKHVCLRCGIEETQEIIEGKFYLVTFYNYDGTRLIRPAYYPYGTEARTPDFTPVRVADNGYTYTFKGYNYSQDEISCVTKRMAIIAEYEATEREYSVTYMNENGTILQTSGNVKYNSISESYIGAVPTKASDEYYNYTFSSWTIQCDSETGTAVATATFDQRLKDPDKTPTSNQPGLLTKFVEWLKNLFKKLFGIK